MTMGDQVVEEYPKDIIWWFTAGGKVVDFVEGGSPIYVDGLRLERTLFTMLAAAKPMTIVTTAMRISLATATAAGERSKEC